MRRVQAKLCEESVWTRMRSAAAVQLCSLIANRNASQCHNMVLGDEHRHDRWITFQSVSCILQMVGEEEEEATARCTAASQASQHAGTFLPRWCSCGLFCAQLSSNSRWKIWKYVIRKRISHFEYICVECWLASGLVDEGEWRTREAARRGLLLQRRSYGKESLLMAKLFSKRCCDAMKSSPTCSLCLPLLSSHAHNRCPTESFLLTQSITIPLASVHSS